MPDSLVAYKKILYSSQLSPSEKVVLFGLVLSEMEIKVEVLAEKLGMKAYTVGQAQRNLVRKGWLSEVKNDGRGKSYRLNFMGGSENGK